MRLIEHFSGFGFFFSFQTKSTLAHLSVMQTVGLQANLIHDPQEICQLTAFLAWASVADRPGQDYSCTSNFPFGPLVGNKASTDAVLWSQSLLVRQTVYGSMGLIELEEEGYLVAGLIQIIYGRSYDAFLLRTDAGGRVGE